LIATVATWGRKLFDAGQLLVEKLSPKSPPSDIFLFRCRQLERKLVIISVDGGKVYVGFLIDFTTDPDEPERYIEIVPIMSGRRQTDTGFVEFTTPYITSNTEPTDRDLAELAVRRAILIPVRKVSTFAPFDVELHKWFKERGLVKGNFDVDKEVRE
jgi:hypothetical protein